MTRSMFYAIVLGAIAIAVGSTQAGSAAGVMAPALKPASTPNEESGQRSASVDNKPDSAKKGASFITGRLIDESGQPIPNAGVFVRKAGASTSQNRSMGTDENGRFRADDLAAGAYSVSAHVPGYVPVTEALQREYYHAGDEVTLRMMKGGVITGTVTNSAGEPVVGVRVSPLRVRDSENKTIRGAVLSGNFRTTDDRGVYRMYGLAPGTYLVVASGGGQMGYIESGFDGDVPTYYPSTNRDAATEVAVRAGEEITGIDIRYRGDRGYIISGTLSGSLGPESGQRGVLVSLTNAAAGVLESRAYVPLRAGRGFALYGVPDGEYDLMAQTDAGTEAGAGSAPRHVVVKGADVTGIDLALAPYGSISGRAVLERIPEAERTSECKAQRIALLDELVLTARRDEKSGVKDSPPAALLSSNESSPDEKGEFKLVSLAAGRYRIETRLPTEDWFVRAITKPGLPAGSKQTDIAGAGLALTTSQRMADLTVTLAEGAAAVRGKVIPAAEGSRLPAQLRVHLVPAEPESADDAIRFWEARIDSEGVFSLTNLAPGIYYLLAQAVARDQLMERNPQPLAWDPAARAKLRREAMAAKVLFDLQRCQRVKDYVIKYTAAPARKAESKEARF